MDNPLSDPNSQTSAILDCANLILTTCFLFEASVKIIAKGLFFNNFGNIKPYLDSGWNRVDFFVVTISVVDAGMTIFGGG
jgi:hypothetical protein